MTHVLRIRLGGDHSAYHCGSAAAFRAIRAAAERAGRVVGEGEDFDLFIMNGEGSMHHDSIGFAKKMTEIKEAIEQGKRVVLANTVWQDNPPEAAEILRRCERITVREVRSQAALRAIGVDSDVAIDQSFYDPVDEQECVPELRGKVILTDFFSREFNSFVKVTAKWTQTHHYVQMHELSWSDMVKLLRSARVLLTGRHHAVYAACRARTPFLTMRGNTHKIEGLLESAGVNIPVFDSFEELHSAYKSKQYRQYDYGALFDWMERQPPWELAVAQSRQESMR